MVRCSSFGNELWTSAKYIRDAAHMPCYQATISQVPNTQSQVKTFLDNIDKAVNKNQLCSHAAILFEPLVEQRSDMQLTEHDGGGNGNFSGWICTPGIEPKLRGLNLRQNSATVVKIFRSFISKR